MVDSFSLYLHIPFCSHRCSYCDFNTYTSVSSLQGAYVEALAAEIGQVAEIAREAGKLRPARSIFFGGGTPSLLTPIEVQYLIGTVEAEFTVVDDVEITLEANPETVEAGYLARAKRAGVNRLSMGMQSANGDELALLGRMHDVQAVFDAVRQARAAGIGNFNLDLVFGLPGQEMAAWAESLRVALTLRPPHLSLYCLTIEEGTPLHRWLRKGEIAMPDADRAAEQYELACRLLSAAGYAHYEISNWALPGYECRHNLAYWRDEAYLGLGAGAHGKAAGIRYSLVRQPRVYIRRMMNRPARQFPLSAAVAEARVLDRQEAMTERVITQLRLLEEGLDLLAFEKEFGQTIDCAYANIIGELEAWGLLRREDSRLKLTNRSWFISNQVFYRFV